MNLIIPEPSLVVLIGPSGSGKSTFANKHFRATEVVSSDRCRALISDDENDQSVTPEAFELLHLIVSRRLQKRRLTIVDATSVQARARRPLLDLAREYATPVIAVVFNLAESTCFASNRKRLQRVVPDQVIATQVQELRNSLPQLSNEGFAAIYVLSDSNQVDQTAIIRQGSAVCRPVDFRTADDPRPGWLRRLLSTFRCQ